MSKRFSSSELFELRNNIPLETVIESLLNLPTKVIEGVYKFLCPRCGEFTAAVNRKTNLSRCFRCKQNFNTIELVMQERKVSFVAAVKILKSIPCSTRRQSTEPKADQESPSSPMKIADVLRALSLSS